MIDELRDLKPRFVTDLKNKGFNIIDMGNGTFDLYIDMDKGRGYFIDLKVTNKHYKRFADKRGLIGLDLTSQSLAIFCMKNLPIIFACDKDNIDKCYLILPEELRVFADEKRKRGLDKILIGVKKHLEKKTYSDALNELVTYLHNNSP